MKQKIPVSNLKIGMYVNELDRPWLDTPFMLQGLLIETEEEIEQLAQYCSFVYVDPFKSEETAASPGSDGSSSVPVPASASLRTPFHGNAVYAETRSVEQELGVAASFYADTAELLDVMTKAMTSEHKFDMSSTREVVTGLRDSIIRNPDALLLLTRMRSLKVKEYQRAIDVAVYMLAFGRELALPTEDLLVLGLGGLLLDIGKLHLPKEILDKEAAYTPSEYRIMKRHVYYGESVLRRNTQIPEGVLRIVAEHHERENGSGYPRGLITDQISAFGRMAAIVDCYTEMVSPGNRNIHISAQEALEMLHGWGGQQFHPALVEVFIRTIGIFPVGSLVELNTGEVAIVLAHPRGSRLRPRVLVITDPKKVRIKEHRILDLTASPTSSFGVHYQIARGLEYGMYGISAEEFSSLGVVLDAAR